jgi:hypothetical protein
MFSNDDNLWLNYWPWVPPCKHSSALAGITACGCIHKDTEYVLFTYFCCAWQIAPVSQDIENPGWGQVNPLLRFHSIHLISSESGYYSVSFRRV